MEKKLLFRRDRGHDKELGKYHFSSEVRPTWRCNQQMKERAEGILVFVQDGRGGCTNNHHL
jgi:hypothetical protein